jgi:hypothetical protein
VRQLRRRLTFPPPSAHSAFISATTDSARVSKILQFLPVLKLSKIYKLRDLKLCFVGNRLQYYEHLGFVLETEL